MASALLSCVLCEAGAGTGQVSKIALYALGTLATHGVCKNAILQEAAKVNYSAQHVNGIQGENIIEYLLSNVSSMCVWSVCYLRASS